MDGKWVNGWEIEEGKRKERDGHRRWLAGDGAEVTGAGERKRRLAFHGFFGEGAEPILIFMSSILFTLFGLKLRVV